MVKSDKIIFDEAGIYKEGLRMKDCIKVEDNGFINP